MAPRCRSRSPGCAAAPARRDPGSAAAQRRRPAPDHRTAARRAPPDGPTATDVHLVQIGSPASANICRMTRSASPWSGIGPRRSMVSPPILCVHPPLAFADPLDQPGGDGGARASGSTSWYFIDDEPELITSTSSSHDSSRALGLDRGDRDGVDDVGDQRTAGQVVDRLAQPLQHRADRDRPGAALHCLVGVVAGVEVREDQHRRPAGHRRVGQLRGGHRRHPTAASYWIGPSTSRSGRRSAHQIGGRADLVHVGAGARVAGRVRQHRHPRVDAELRRGRRRRDRDVGQLLGARVGIHRAVAVDQHLVRQAHQEDAGHDGRPRARS